MRRIEEGASERGAKEREKGIGGEMRTGAAFGTPAKEGASKVGLQKRNNYENGTHIR